MTVHPVCSPVNNHSQNSSLVFSPLKTHSSPASSCTTHRLGSWFPFSCRHSKSKNNRSCNDSSTGSSSTSRSPYRRRPPRHTRFPAFLPPLPFLQKAVFSFSWFRVECSSDGPRVATYLPQIQHFVKPHRCFSGCCLQHQTSCPHFVHLIKRSHTDGALPLVCLCCSKHFWLLNKTVAIRTR